MTPNLEDPYQIDQIIGRVIPDLERNGYTEAVTVIRELLAIAKLFPLGRCFVKGCRNKSVARYSGINRFCSCVKHQPQADEVVRETHVVECPVCSVRFGAGGRL